MPKPPPFQVRRCFPQSPSSSARSLNPRQSHVQRDADQPPKGQHHVRPAQKHLPTRSPPVLVLVSFPPAFSVPVCPFVTPLSYLFSCAPSHATASSLHPVFPLPYPTPSPPLLPPSLSTACCSSPLPPPTTGPPVVHVYSNTHFLCPHSERLPTCPDARCPRDQRVDAKPLSPRSQIRASFRSSASFA